MNINSENWLSLLAEDILERKSLYPDSDVIPFINSTNWLILLKDDILKRGSLYPSFEAEYLDSQNWLLKLRDVIIKNASLYPNTGPILVSSIKIIAEKTELVIGETMQLQAQISPSNAENKNTTWGASSGAGKVTITTAGLAKGLSVGTTTIQCKALDASKVYSEIALTCIEG